MDEGIEQEESRQAERRLFRLSLGTQSQQTQKSGDLPTTRPSVDQHVRHSERDSLVCRFCRQKFSSVTLLDLHRSRDLTKSGKRFCCVCYREFSNVFALIKHRRQHLGFEPVQCPQCLMAFSATFAKEQHVREVHISNVTSRVCYKCGWKTGK